MDRRPQRSAGQTAAERRCSGVFEARFSSARRRQASGTRLPTGTWARTARSCRRLNARRMSKIPFSAARSRTTDS